MRSPAWHRIVVLVLAPPMAATAAGFFGGASWFLDLFAHFRAQYAASLLLGAAALLLLRRPRWGAFVACAGLVNVAVLAPQIVVWSAAEAKGTRTIRLVLVNVNSANENYGRLLELVAEVDPEVVLLEEVDAGWVEGVSALASRYPHSAVAPLPNNFGIGLWSRLPVVSAETISFVDGRLPSIVATLDVDGKNLVLIGTHPLPPRSRKYAELRDRQLDTVAQVAQGGGPHVIVLGDLNTTPWGHAFRELVSSSGLSDSSRGRGLQWSWPAGFWPLAIPIDHCLTSERVRVIDRFFGPDLGSDHYPLVVDVILE